MDTANKSNEQLSSIAPVSPLSVVNPLNVQGDDLATEPHFEVAAIDLGSNSFHMIVARIVNGSFQVLARLKQRVQLIDGMSDAGELSRPSIDRALSCLALFAERLDGFDTSRVRVIASYSLRAASNATDFLELAQAVFPYPIEVISGHEEARLIYMGVAHTQPEKGKKLVVDIGGGSTEIIIGEGFSPLTLESVNIGCVSFYNRFFETDKINAKIFDKAVIMAQQQIDSIAWRYHRIGWENALGTSGTIKSVHQILMILGDFDGLITLDKLLYLSNILIQFKSINDISFPDLSDERKKVLLPGLAILIGVFKSLNIQSMRYADSALREGILYEMEGVFRHEDIRVRTAESFAEHYAIDRNQVARVLETVQALSRVWREQTQNTDKKGIDSILNWAVILHEVGLSINQSSMHKHSAYIIQYSDLPGFSQEQQLLLATLVRFHRRAIKEDELPRFNLYKKKHYFPFLQIFRLGVLLNNQRQSTTRPESMRVEIDGFHWRLIFPKDYLVRNSLLELDLQKEQEYWKDVDGWQLIIEEEQE
ncbi:Ppx/GppA phosphatase family protein [Thorsellia kenyensis]|uniref:Exopolyphosphatase n=1 Tax=Thorsellia kenyensis TaxID=1549888 RepID=A0ABV6CBH6_9GAMM